MAIHTTWYDDTHTIGLMTFTSDFTWEDIEQAHRDLAVLYSQVSYPVYTIADYRRAGPPPTNLFLKLDRVKQMQPPQTEFTVFVGGHHRLVRVAADVFQRAFGGVHLADKLDEAVALIEQAAVAVESQK